MLIIKSKKYAKFCISIAVLLSFTFQNVLSTYSEENTVSENQDTGVTASSITIQAEAGILLEASTGTIIFEKDADKQLVPASITKIMTLLLIFDALESKKITLDEVVTTSEYAASMGGSQVFLEAMEQQTVETMIKCISVASANDACVAMAEHIAGTEAAFVDKMNERAKALGMTQTNFVNCCGLDIDGHVTSARDVAIMSRELINKYPQIFQYSGIWMENITHTTSKGSKEFGLTNTNKLIKQYPYATGLKTGSTSKAKYCVSATAEKDGIELIAVIMAAPDYKVRFSDAAALLDYGFANCSVYKDNEMPKLKDQKVENSLKDKIKVEYEGEFSYLSVNDKNLSSVEKKKEMKKIKAPVKEGDIVGELAYYIDGEKIGSVNIIAKESAKQADISNYFRMLWKEILL